MRRTVPRGFTLIEVMMVVAIIGLLASMGITGYGKLTQRARSVERQLAMARIAAGAKAFLSERTQNGNWNVGGWNPPKPWTQDRKNFNIQAGNWQDLQWEPSGPVYYHYNVTGRTSRNNTYFYVYALRQDRRYGRVYYRQHWRLLNGNWVLAAELTYPTGYPLSEI